MASFQFAAAVIGAVTGVVSLLIWLFGAGRRVGNLETKVSSLESKLIDHRDWGELRNKVETLYNIYVMEALRRGGRGLRDDDDQPRNPR